MTRREAVSMAKSSRRASSPLHGIGKAAFDSGATSAMPAVETEGDVLQEPEPESTPRKPNKAAILNSVGMLIADKTHEPLTDVLERLSVRISLGQQVPDAQVHCASKAGNRQRSANRPWVGKTAR